MKFLIKNLSLILVCVVHLSAYASEESDNSFQGEWCGKWDNTYKLCIIIDQVNNGSVAKYSWQEKVKGSMRNTTKRISRFNQHTLKLENIWFTLDSKDPTKAKITGMFSQTRHAELTRQP